MRIAGDSGKATNGNVEIDGNLLIASDTGTGNNGHLTVNGLFTYNDAGDSTQQPGYVLATDGSGNASWQSPQSVLGGSLWSVDSNGTGIYNTNLNNVGIGTGNPVNMLDVSGGMAIGTDYAGVDSIGAPGNGMLVEGSVGVGTTHPFSKMEIVGNLTLTPLNPVDSPGIGNADIQLNSAWRPTIYPFGPNVPGSMDMQIRSADSGTLWLNHDNPGNIIMNWGNGGGNVGIGGLSSPIAKLDIQGTLRVNDGTQQQGYVFVSDSNGIGSWQSPGSLTGGLWSQIGTGTGVYNTSLGKVGIGTNSPMAKLGVNGNVTIGSAYVNDTSAPSQGLAVQGRVGIGTPVPANMLDVAGGVVIGAAYARDSTAPSNGLLVQGGVGIGLSKPLPQDMLDVKGAVTIGDSAGITAAPANGLSVSGGVQIGNVPQRQGTLHVGGTAVVDSVFQPRGGTWASGVASTMFNATPSIHANADEHKGGGIAISDNGGFIDYHTNNQITFAGTRLRISGFTGPGSRGSLEVDGGLSVFGDTTTSTNGALTVNGTFYYNSWDTTQKAGYVLTTNGSGMASWASSPSGLWLNGTGGIYSSANVGIGTATPASALEVSGGDVYISNSANGVIMKSPDGTCYRLTVANGGSAVFTAITCP